MFPARMQRGCAVRKDPPLDGAARTTHRDHHGILLLLRLVVFPPARPRRRAGARAIRLGVRPLHRSARRAGAAPDATAADADCDDVARDAGYPAVRARAVAGWRSRRLAEPREAAAARQGRGRASRPNPAPAVLGQAAFAAGVIAR